MKKTIRFLGKGLLIFCLLLGNQVHAQNCGLDIYIANDQSGSVDATENTQSRDFILKLAQAHALGNASTQNRIAIASWDNSYFPFAFSGAGLNYTTDMADIVAFKNASRTINGGTDAYQALLNAFQKVNQTPVSGRSVRKVILLLTDASPGQVSANITALATQIKNTGIIIAVMAIGDASNITLLQGNSVATDPSVYFSASSYAALSTNAVNAINSFLTNVCTATIPDPTWDLSVHMNTSDCGTGEVNYTVSNLSSVNFSNTLSTTFYDGDPSFSGTNVLATDVRPAQSIIAGGNQSFTFTDPSLLLKAHVWAVVNINTAGNNAITPVPTNLSSRLFVSGDQNPYNNISNGITAFGCATTSPVLEVSNKFIGLSCDKKLTYQVQVCNKGAVPATDVALNFVPGSNNLVLKNATAALGNGKTIAAMANPGNDTSIAGYDGYQSTPLFPCASNDITTPCARFNYAKGTGGSGFYSNAVFSFPPVAPNSGVPANAVIIAAKLVAKTGTGGMITAIKQPNVPRFDSTNQPGDLWTANPTIANTPATGSVVDVTAIAQELVNQPGWTANSTMAFIWKGTKVIMSIAATDTSSLQISYMAPFSLPAGECATFTYVYQDTSAAGGTYNASVGVSTITPGAVISPNNNFATNGVSALNGYNGAANTTEDAVVPASTGCSQTPQPITTSVTITPTNICAGTGNYVTATVTINNPNTQPLPSGITLYNLLQNLKLTGTGATFSGEPYGFTNGIELAQANVIDPAYPAVANALSGKTGTQSLQIFKLLPGSSTFKIDLVAGTTTFNLASFISDIPASYNAGGTSATAQDATGVTVNTAPIATINCPAPITAAATTLNVTGTTSGTGGTTPIAWSSTTNGVFTPNGGSTNAAPDYSYTVTDLDKAQGFVNIQLSTLSASGCDASANCRIFITGAQMDYGDLPSTYDFNGITSPVAAGAMNPTSLIMLGAIGAGADAVVKSGINADGDGAEEDGVTAFNPITPNMISYSVSVNYASNVPATVCGWFDWNNNGYFDAGEGVCNAVTANPNGTTTLSWNNINNGAGASVGMLGYARFRVSSNSMDIYSFNGATTNGEVEDYRVLPTPLPLNLLSFDAVKQGSDALLSWTTAREMNTDYFDVEASTDGNTYNVVGQVKAKGTSEIKQQYTFKHTGLDAARYYYRLKMADKNGTFSYSGTRILNFGSKTAFMLLPNPAKDQVQISGLPAAGNVYVMDATGREILRLNTTGTTTTISIASLLPGLYQVIVTDQQGMYIGSQKMIKQ